MHALGSILLALLASSAPRGDGALGVVGARAVDVDGAVHRLGMREGVAPVALVFLDTECPVANRYAPRLNELARSAAEAGVELYGVYSDPRLAASAARAHRDEHALELTLLFDPNGALAERLSPTHVPEAFVLRRDDTLAYRGRIDDAWEARGRPRAEARSHELLDAVRAVAERREPALARAEPVGCVFEAWDAAPPPPTYAREIAPILSAGCVECHRADDVAPFALATYEDARKRARTIAEVCADGSMPPWRAQRGSGLFRDERSLAPREVAALRAWAEAGAPEGDRAELLPTPSLPAGRWRLGEPDLVVTLPVEFEVPAAGPDLYQYFVVPSTLAEERGLVAADFRPGERSVVHHCLVYLDTAGFARRIDGADEAPGFTRRALRDEEGADDALLAMETIAGWAPGNDAFRFPAGLGQRVPAGGDFVLEIHYHPSGRAARDRSELGLYFARPDAPVERWVEGLVIGTEHIDIPAGEAEYLRQVWMEFPLDVELVDLTPHAHTIAREIESWATLPDGRRLDLLRIPEWDFRWQTTYVLREPLLLPRGTRLDALYRYDNSAANPANPSSPPIRVKEGWQTTDEMCLFYFTVVPEDPDEMEAVYARMIESFLRSGAAE